MPGAPHLRLNANLLATLAGITRTAGYDLPADLDLITDEVLMWDQVGGRYPAVIQQMEDSTPESHALGHRLEERIPYRWIVYFREEDSESLATTALRYRLALQRGLMQDTHRGGDADLTQLDTQPTPLIFRGNGDLTVFELTVRWVCLVEYDGRAVALTA